MRLHQLNHASRRPARLMVATLAIAMIACSSAMAQQQGRGRGGFGGGRLGGFGGSSPALSRLFLLGSEAVQGELKLTADQKASVQKLLDGWRESQEAMRGQFRGDGGGDESDRQARFEKMRKAIEEKATALGQEIDKALTTEQVTRLKQIALQVRGVDALRDDDVVAALKLTDDQKSQLAAIRDDLQTKTRELFGRGGRGGAAGGQSREDRQANRQKMTALREEAMAKSLAVLTAEQREQFEKMKGAKFELPPAGPNA